MGIFSNKDKPVEVKKDLVQCPYKGCPFSSTRSSVQQHVLQAHGQK